MTTPEGEIAPPGRPPCGAPPSAAAAAAACDRPAGASAGIGALPAPAAPAQAIEPQPGSAEVVDKQLIGDIARLLLRPDPAAPLRHRPGQYLHVVLDDGRRRPFSIANAPRADGLIELHVRRVAGGDVSGLVFGALAAGDRLRLEGPFGRLCADAPATAPDAAASPVLLIAGGTGFAPIKAIAEHLLHAGRAPSIALYWGARQASELYDHALACDWQRRHAHFRYVPVVSEGHAPAQMRRGLVHEAALQDHPQLGAHVVYLSGPPAMVHGAAERLRQAGLAEDRLHYDRHDAPAATPPSAPAAPTQDA